MYTWRSETGVTGLCTPNNKLNAQQKVVTNYLLDETRVMNKEFARQEQGFRSVHKKTSVQVRASNRMPLKGFAGGGEARF